MNLENKVRGSVWDSVSNSVGDSAWVWNSVRDSALVSVRDSVWSSVEVSVGNSVRDSIDIKLKEHEFGR